MRRGRGSRPARLSDRVAAPLENSLSPVQLAMDYRSGLPSTGPRPAHTAHVAFGRAA